jgi:tetratricopeptide (TPR) repeat protein
MTSSPPVGRMLVTLVVLYLGFVGAPSEAQAQTQEANAALGMQLFNSGRLAEAEPHLALALARAPDDADLAFLLGLVRAETGDLSGAEAAIKGFPPSFETRWVESLILQARERHEETASLLRALETEPAPAWLAPFALRFRIAANLVQASRESEDDLHHAEQLARRSIPYARDSVFVHEQLLRVLSAREDWLALRVAAEVALRTNPGHIPFLAARVDALARLDDGEALTMALRRLYDSSGDRPVGLVAVRQMLATGKLADAEDLLFRILKQEPQNAEAALLLADLFAATQRAPVAQGILQELRRRDPLATPAVQRLGKLAAADADWPRAAAIYDTLSTLSDGDFNPLAEAVAARALGSDWQGVLSTAAQARSWYPDSLWLLEMTAIALDSLGRETESMRRYAELDSRDPSRALYQYADVVWRAGNRGEALALTSRPNAPDPPPARALLRVAMFANGARCEVLAKTFARAIDTAAGADQGAVSSAGTPRSYWLLVLAREDRRLAERVASQAAGNLRSACAEKVIQDSFDRATAAHPQSPRLRLLLADYYASGGQLQRALEAATLSVELAPRLTDAHLLLATLWQQLGEPQKAERALTVAASLEPSLFHVWKTLVDLSQRQGTLEALIERTRIRVERGDDGVQRRLDYALRVAARGSSGG